MKEFFSSTVGKIVAAATAAALIIAGIILLSTSGAGADTTTRGIGLNKSIAVSLADAGLKEDQVKNLQGHFETDDGLDAYDVSFIANNYEYEYTIKATDGAILECKIESPEGLHVGSSEANDIGQDKALEAALKHAGLKKSDVELTKSRKDMDDGRIVYEFDFLKDNISYEYDVDGTTAGIIEFSREVIDKKTDTSASGNSSQAGTGDTNVPKNESKTSADGKNDTAASWNSNHIGVDKAKSIALGNAGLKSSDVTFTSAKLERDDGGYVYEIDFHSADTEYDYEIDAVTGKILGQDKEPLDDRDYDDNDDELDD